MLMSLVKGEPRSIGPPARSLARRRALAGVVGGGVTGGRLSPGVSDGIEGGSLLFSESNAHHVASS